MCFISRGLCYGILVKARMGSVVRADSQAQDCDIIGEIYGYVIRSEYSNIGLYTKAYDLSQCCQPCGFICTCAEFWKVVEEFSKRADLCGF